jgi:CRP-like cAMP-binding protein
VEQGVVKLACLDMEGKEAIVGIAAPGMSFGRELSSLEVYQAIALGEVRLNQFLLSDLEASAELSQTLLPSLIQRSKQTESLLAVAGQRKVQDRLQQLLLLLAQTVGQPIAGGTRIRVRLTHEELASLIRSSRVTVTRLLGHFKRQGWLAVDRTHHLIVKQVALLDLDEEFGGFKLNQLRSSSNS